MKTHLLKLFFILFCFCTAEAEAQPFANKGKEFWVGYGHHQYMEKNCDGTGTATNEQNMTLYLSAEEDANVTVTIDSSGIGGLVSTWWQRTYFIPAGTVVNIEESAYPAASYTTIAGPWGNIPKGGATGYDARLWNNPPPSNNGGEGHFRKRGIHIESDVPIVAYAHIWGQVSSGATMLMPIETWGTSYTSVNSQQGGADRSYSWMYVIAKEDNTKVQITPSEASRLGKPAGVPFEVTLMKGQIYQLIGQADCLAGFGVQLTGTTIKSVPASDGVCRTIAVFAGSSRTAGEVAACGGGSRDNDMQQLFPDQAWGMKYLTAPFSRASGSTLQPSSFQTSVYKVVVKDPTTVVKRNGVTLTGLINNKYYQFNSNTADYLTADKPVMVAQFMAAQGSTCNPGSGDPEMVTISPVEQAAKVVNFYRNTREAITTNYVTLVVPTAGLASLRIDNSTIISHSYPHPNKAGYTVVVRGWAASPSQCSITCDSAFNAVTYGMGGAESYAFNAGTNLLNLNGIGQLHNIFDSTKTISDYTCRKTPIKLTALIAYQPTQIIWKLSSLGSSITPNADVTVSSPVSEGTVVIDGYTYYKYSLSGTYKFNDVGTQYIPIIATQPSTDPLSCARTEELTLKFEVRESPVANFTYIQTADCGNQVCFTSPTTANVGFTIKNWRWQFPDGSVDSTRTPCKTFGAAGNYSIYSQIISNEGCLGDTTKQITVTSPAANPLTITPSTTICEGSGINITATGGTTYTWSPATGLSSTTGGTVTASPTTTTTYTVTSIVTGCTYQQSVTITVTPKPPLPTVVSPVTYCQGDPHTPLTATPLAGNTITWYNNPALTGGYTTTPDPGTTTPAVTTYWVTQKTAGNCTSNAATITVTVYAQIGGNTIGSDQAVCGTTPINPLSAASNPTGGTGVYVYQWQNSTDGGTTWNNISGANSASYPPPATAGTIKYRRMITSGQCSSLSNVATVTLYSALTGTDITGGNQTICNGDPAPTIIGQTPGGGSGTYSYQWEKSTDNVSWSVMSGETNKDLSPGAITTSTYYRRKLVSSTCSVYSSTVLITVNAKPMGTITGATGICQYDAYAVNFNASAGTGPYTVQLNVTGPGGYSNSISQSIGSTGSISILPANSTPGSYTITFTSISDANNCSRTTGLTGINFFVTARPMLTVSPDVPICNGSSVNLTVSGADSYVWSPAGSLNTPTGSTVTATPTTNTTYIVTGTTNGCTNSGSVTVTVNPIPPKPVVPSQVIYCQNAGSTALAAAGSPGHTLTWYDNAGLTNPQASITPPTGTAGSTVYYVTQTSPENCRSLAETITVMVQASITGNTITGDQTNCEGGLTGTIPGTGTLQGGNGSFAYSWEQSTDGGTTWSTIAGQTGAAFTPPSTAGVKKYRRIVSSGSCASTSNVVTVTIEPPLGNNTITGISPVCEGENPPQINGQLPTGGNGTYSYQWQSSPDQTTWTNISGGTNKDLTPTPLTANTYFRRVTTSGNCTSPTNAVLVTVNPKPMGVIGNAAICEYNAASISFTSSAGTAPFTIVLNVSGPGGYTATINQSVSSSATILILPANSAPGSYTITITSLTDSKGCSRTTGFTTGSITVTAKPALTVSPNVPICNGGNTILTASGATTYSWAPATGLSATTGSSVTANPTTTTTYTVTGTTNGCIATAQVTVTVNPVPAIPVVNTPVTYCQATASVPLSATGAAGNTITWYSDAALTTTLPNPYNPPTGTAGTTNYYATQTNGFNCRSQSATVIVTVQPTITANTIGADQLLCTGSSANPIGSATAPSGGTNSYTYQWQRSTDATTWNNIPGETALTYNPGAPANTTYYRRVVNSGMCTSTSNVVTISIQGAVSNTGITGTQPVCSGQAPTQLDGQPAGAVTYQWEMSLNNSTWSPVPSNGTNEDYQPPALTTTTYYRRKVSNGACSSVSNTVTVSVNPLPNGNLAGSTVCEYEAASINFSATAGTAPYEVKMTITGPGGYSSNITNTMNGDGSIAILPPNSLPGTYNIAFNSIKDNNGCERTSGLSPVTITVNARPVLNVPSTVPGCQGTSTTLTASGATTYVWSPGAGLSSTTGASVTATPSATTTYTVTGTTNGCSTAKDVTVTVNPRPNASFTADADVCQNKQATFTPATTSSNVVSWKWDFDDGSGQQIYTNDFSFTRPYTTAKSYNVKLVTVDANNCVSDTARQTLNVRPLPVANFTLPSSICLPNGVANFKNTTTISDNSTLSWLWDLGDQSPTVTTKDPSHVYPANGPYNVTLTATSPYGCQDISSQFLNSSAFFDKPIAQFDVTPEALCHGMDNVFTDNSTAPNSSISTWSWNFDDGSPLSSQRNPVKRYKAPGVYEVSLVVKSAQGCVSDTAKTEVTVYLQPVVDAGPSFVVPAGTIVTFRPKVNDSTLSFNWSPSQDFQDPTELTQILVAQKDQIYTLFAEGEGGCVASDTLVIKILNPVTVPNAFSPNGDGINDTWEIPYLKDYPGATVQVFNRYGQQVYFAYGYSRPWDGRLNGTSLPVGTYYYIVTLKNGFAPINGSITIVK